MGTVLHEKIYSDILAKIKNHHFEEGVMLPTESELAQLYGVSKAPVRQALSRLELEGFILRQAGKGTFVAGRENWPYLSMSGFADELSKKAKFLYCTTLSIKVSKLSKTLATYLSLPVGTKNIEVKRVRYYKNQPVNFLHHHVFPIDKKAIESEGNFSSFLAIYDKLGVPVTAASDEVEAVRASKDISKWLKIEPGHPLLVCNRRIMGENDKLMDFVQVYANSTFWKYRIEFKNSK